jgi:hypothetical protein
MSFGSSQGQTAPYHFLRQTSQHNVIVEVAEEDGEDPNPSGGYSSERNGLLGAPQPLPPGPSIMMRRLPSGDEALIATVPVGEHSGQDIPIPVEPLRDDVPNRPNSVDTLVQTQTNDQDSKHSLLWSLVFSAVAIFLGIFVSWKIRVQDPHIPIPDFDTNVGIFLVWYSS